MLTTQMDHATCNIAELLLLLLSNPCAAADEDEAGSRKGGKDGELDEEAWRKMESYEARGIDAQTLQEVGGCTGQLIGAVFSTQSLLPYATFRDLSKRFP